jgi:DNA-binding CsgD family transcriptional regulator
MLVQEADTAEILDLIHRNRIAIWMQDFDAYADCFVHAPYTTRWNASHINGIFIRAGWDDISRRVREMFASHPGLKVEANAYQTTVENLMLRVQGDVAWALFDQRYPGVATPVPIHSRGLTHEMRVFERHDGRWKIAFFCYLDEDTSQPGRMMVLLDPEGRVLWQTPAAAKGFDTEDDLVIRNGRLRVRDRRVDERLQAAIGWAASRDKGYLIDRAALPIVCPAGDNVPAKVWWIIVDSGEIWFSFSDPGLTEARLSAAAAVFGLSATQQEVAARVARGLSLTDIAGELGITANTARTHLDRIFDKVGVRTQAALVRVLLSTAAPI